MQHQRKYATSAKICNISEPQYISSTICNTQYISSTICNIINNMQNQQYATSTICNINNMQHQQYATSATICNISDNMQHQRQYATSANPNTYHQQYATPNTYHQQYATSSTICKISNMQHQQYATSTICNINNMQHQQQYATSTPMIHDDRSKHFIREIINSKYIIILIYSNNIIHEKRGNFKMHSVHVIILFRQYFRCRA